MTPAKKKKPISRRDRATIAFKKTAEKATSWIGSTKSLIVHTVVFVSAFVIPLFGVAFDRVLLVLTTALSLEAIYLAIFIQMSVNKNTADIEVIQEDVEDIQEEIEEIGDDVEEIQKDVDEIQVDVDEIQEDIEEIEEDSDHDVKVEEKEQQTLTAIAVTLAKLQEEIEALKKK